MVAVDRVGAGNI